MEDPCPMLKNLELTNKNQLRILIDEMKKNEDIARSMSLKTSAEELAFWCGLQLKLNSNGPPVKQVPEWKKVWSNYKSNIRKKLAINLASLSNKDPSKFVPLNALEEEVNQLLDIENSILVGLYDSEGDEVVTEYSSSQDIYSLDDFQKRKENSAEAVKLYDLQIEMLQKEISSWENIGKKKPDVVPSSNSSTISSPQSPIADAAFQMKIEFVDVEEPCSSENTSIDKTNHSDNREQEKSLVKKRKLNTNALSEKKENDIDRVRIKTEIKGENEAVGNIKCSSNKGIFIIDTAIPPPLSPAPTPPKHTIDMAISPLPPLTPAPTLPTLTKNLQYTSTTTTKPSTFQRPPNLIKRKFDSSKNTDGSRKNNSCSHESILTNISNALQEIQQTNKNFTSYLERLCASEEKQISLMEDANKEQKRHHQQIEKMAKI